MINEDKVNQSLKRLLVARFKLGDFDKDETVSWTQIPEKVIACKAHKDLAEKIAEEGIVLLQNRNQLLPLNRNQKIVVMDLMPMTPSCCEATIRVILPVLPPSSRAFATI